MKALPLISTLNFYKLMLCKWLIHLRSLYSVIIIGIIGEAMKKSIVQGFEIFKKHLVKIHVMNLKIANKIIHTK